MGEAAPSDGAPADGAKPSDVGEAPVITPSTEPVPGEEAPRPAPVSAQSREEQIRQLELATIMMVDDEPLTTEIIRNFLQDAGYSRFVITDDSSQALDLLRERRPDVLLLDLMMPRVSGFDILEAMQAEEELSHIPVLVLTSATDAETKLRVLELGATDFLGKPVDPSELVLRLRNTLSSKAYQDQLAFHDGLTALPNRRVFLERLESALLHASNDNRAVAVVHVGLDRFKQINDTLGLRAGDELLRLVARRLERIPDERELIPGTERELVWAHLSRLGGDEFAFIVPNIERIEDAAVEARKVLAGIAEPIALEGEEVFVTPSIGIAVFPYDGVEGETLLKHASIATHYAKQHGRNAYHFYSRDINARSLERLKLEGDLRKAMEHEELSLHYQPKVDTRTGRLKGVEALLRWEHPKRGMISPADFIPIAEETGLIIALGDWVVLEACKQNVAWRQQGLPAVPISINVSPQQFHERQVLRTLRTALRNTGVDPRLLTVELTEATIMERAERNIMALHEMKDMGLRLSIDDFGTGYSSLSYLKRFPLDELKIDRSFLRELQNTDDAAIVTAIIALGRSLGLKVVAEGVETREQLAFLRAKRCDICQGYLFSKPMPAPELAALFSKGRKTSPET